MLNAGLSYQLGANQLGASTLAFQMNANQQLINPLGQGLLQG